MHGRGAKESGTTGFGDAPEFWACVRHRAGSCSRPWGLRSSSLTMPGLYSVPRRTEGRGTGRISVRRVRATTAGRTGPGPAGRGRTRTVLRPRPPWSSRVAVTPRHARRDLSRPSAGKDTAPGCGKSAQATALPMTRSSTVDRGRAGERKHRTRSGPSRLSTLPAAGRAATMSRCEIHGWRSKQEPTRPHAPGKYTAPTRRSSAEERSPHPYAG